MKTSVSMYCEHCGALIEADSKFCAQCGNKLSETSASQSQVQSEPFREMGEDPTSKPLAVAGIGILAWLIGTLLFSGIYRSSSGRIPLLSDSDKLSRSEAERIIIQINKLPFVETRTVNLVRRERLIREEVSKDATYTPPKTGELLQLERAGFLTYTIQTVSWKCISDHWGRGGRGFFIPAEHRSLQLACDTPEPQLKFEPKPYWHKFRFEGTYDHVGTLTEKGKQEVRNGNQFTIFRYDFGSITGVVESPGLNITEVHYTVLKTLSEVGIAAFGLRPQSETIQRVATFRKYDDGWRIEG